MTKRLGGDGGIGNLILAGATDAHDGAQPGPFFPFADNAAGSGVSSHAPESGGVPELDLAVRQIQINGEFAFAGNHNGPISRHSNRHRAPAPAVTLAQVSRMGGLEHGHGFRRQWIQGCQRPYR